MSKILIFAERDLTADDYLYIQKFTGKSISTIKKSISDDNPMAEYILFMDDYKEIAEKIKLMNQKFGDKIGFFEVEDMEEDTNLQYVRQHRISSDTLFNILESAENYE
ncbi:hypothetical protein EHF33_13630 [Deinococcus psychrotolerans]|uniref:Uncharacterized protein n=1 Tax=Deinococcus psychrotolerans TaxID=2489213 RepID=A0A3G8YPU5_9DEIO|nr:hypothetical protein [Deinococcus psychrotolerans]AZI43661.1 hypothetical protein EHF33_13630 [Deinococcus psychrotolerans]